MSDAAARLEQRPDCPTGTGGFALHERVRPLTIAALAALLAGVFVPLWSLRSAATTNGSLQAQAAAISAKLESDQSLLASLSERYLIEHTTFANAESAARRTKVEIGSTEHKITGERDAVRAAVVEAYVNAGSTSEIGLLLSGSPNELGTNETYLHVAESDLAKTVTSLTNSEASLQRSVTTEQRAVAAASQALLATGAARSEVLTTLGKTQALLGSVRGQVAALVAAQAAARERAAEQAAAAAAEQAAAAQAAANQAAAATSTTGPPSHSAPTTPSAPPAPAAGAPTLTGITSIATNPTIPSSLSDEFAAIRNCESGDRYYLNTGNGYYGAYQFSLSTWDGLGESGLPSVAPDATQDSAALTLYHRSGWGAWPECSAILGLG